MSLSEIRAELRELRKSAVPPVSRMKKQAVVAELESRRAPAKVEEVYESESDVESEAPPPKAKKPAKKVVVVESESEEEAPKPKKKPAKVAKKPAKKPEPESEEEAPAPKKVAKVAKKPAKKAEPKAEAVSVKHAPRKKRAD
jgi:ribonuclease E